MFIYKITVNERVYIGLDTKPCYKNSRWKYHCKMSKTENPRQLVHKEMKKYGIENCSYEVIESGFESIIDLALSEINYIKLYDSFRNGLNSTLGGDGLGRKDLYKLSSEEVDEIKSKIGNNFSRYNNMKWSDTSKAERKLLTKHLHNSKVYDRRSKTLKEYYKNNPDSKKEKGNIIKKWQEENKEKMLEQNRISGLKGAEKVSIKLKVEMPNKTVKIFKSKNEFQRETKQWASTIIKKTKEGKSHNGYRAWEIK